MKHYTARAIRSGKWWAITVDGLKGAHSQTKRLDRVEDNAREVISLMTDQDPDSFTVDVVQEMPDEWKKALEHYFSLINRVSELERDLSRTQYAVVHELTEEGLTVRDVGELMRLSHQRIAQLAKRPVPEAVDEAPAAHPVG